MSNYVRSQVFRPGTFLKPCGICGIRFRADELVRGDDGFYRCRRWCIEVTALTRDKISAESQKRREAPPPPHGEPFDRKSTYADEDFIFNFLCEQPVQDAGWPGGIRLGVPPFDFIDATNGGYGAPAANPATGNIAYSIWSAGECCRYLYGIISENKRPARWVATAKTKLRQLADWLITKQRGFGASPASTKTNDSLWGGVSSPDPLFDFYVTAENAAAGLALLYAYRSLGDAKYLVSAQASASYLRNAQAAPDVITGVNSTTGAIVRSLNTITDTDAVYLPSCLLALEFWSALLTTAGDANYGGDSTTGGFTAVPQQLLSKCIADLRAFWLVGAYNAATGTTVNGLSSASLCDSYAVSSKQWMRVFDNYSATNGWFVASQAIAIALRSLFIYEGFSAQVADVWKYLTGFASNSAFAASANSLASDYSVASTSNSATPPTPPVGQGNIIAPSYQPKLALSNTLLVRSLTTNQATAQNAYDYSPWFVNTAQQRCTYDWTTMGLMAAIQSSQDQGSLRKAKDAVTTARLRMPIPFEYGPSPVTETPMLRGSSGLAFQLSHGDDFNVYPGVRRLWSATAAAMIGNAFRYQPQAWTGSNPPSQNPGLQV